VWEDELTTIGEMTVFVDIFLLGTTFRSVENRLDEDGSLRLSKHIIFRVGFKHLVDIEIRSR
jgi:hypothetical protein